MPRKLNAQRSYLIQKAMALAAALGSSISAQAVSPTLSSLGQSGGAVIPYAFVLPEGGAEVQYNNFIDPRYGAKATDSQIYWGALGLVPYVEVSGGMANYPGHASVRHLMADIKVQVPQFLRYQPAIAFGMTDIGGRTHYFRSKYGVVSQSFGPAALTIGYGQDERLAGLFGGAQLSLWNTGLSLLAEDDSKTPYVGMRYQSPRISWLAEASVTGTLMRAVRSTNGVAPRTSFAIGLQIPLGKRFDAEPVTRDASNAVVPAAVVSSDNRMHNRTSNVAGAKIVSGALRQPDALQPLPRDANGLVGVPTAYGPPLNMYASAGVEDASPLMQKIAAAAAPEASNVYDPSALDAIAARLFASGLERVRVGISGRDLIVEYENHRYNQNEADALGIVLGVASVNALHGIERIHAVIKKANEAIGEISVDRDAYAQFVANGVPGKAAATLTLRTRPTYDAGSIAWHGDEKKHGLTRVQILPVTRYLYGTEYGRFDVSLGVNVAAYVPLWKGAELVGSYIAPFYNTKNMDDGRVYSQYRLRNGLSSVALAQSFWVAPQVFNVAAVGKFDFDYVGVENETTVFVPGRPDLVRLRLAYLHQEPGHDGLPGEKNAEITYRWVQPAWKLWVEAGVARFVGGDKGPEITFTRWFDDVSFSVHGEYSGQGSFVGATISFPLTPRRGMRPGITQVDGADQFSLDFRTRVGATNYLASGAVENLSFPYSTQQVLLNQGRFSAGYFATQLNRMRDAYERYAPPDSGTANPALHPQTSGSPASVTSPRSVCANFFRAVGDGQAQASAACK
nr:YjbH domain-containing protein [Paraburkholderia sp. BL6665CI2N2]